MKQVLLILICIALIMLVGCEVKIVEITDKKESSQVEASQEATSTKEVVEIPQPENVTDVDYVELWSNFDYEENHGDWVRITGKVGYVGKDNFNIEENLPSGATNKIFIEYTGEEKLDYGDTVTVVAMCDHKKLGYLYLDYPEIEYIEKNQSQIIEYNSKDLIKAWKEDANAIREENKGNLMQVTGLIDSININETNPEKTYVSLSYKNQEYKATTVMCYIALDEQNKLVNYQAGDTITIQGKLEHVPLIIDVENCKIIN